MKILLLIQNLHYGGTQRQLFYLAQGLQSRGHSIVVWAFYSGGLLEKPFHEAGISIKFFNKRGRWDIVGFIKKLRRVLREERPDVVYSLLAVPNILSILSRFGNWPFRIIWGVRASHMHLENYNRFVRMSYWVERRLARFPDLIIVNSQSGVSHAVGVGFPEYKMVCIPNGIDTTYYDQNRQDIDKIRAEWGVQKTDIVIGLIGRLDPMKDHQTFLRAASVFLQDPSFPVRFVCVGDGEPLFRDELHALAKQLKLSPYLIWVGPTEDMSCVYHALDIACSSSLFGEGFPNVIGEAMACGRPCVVTDVGDSKLVVGDTGFVVPAGDYRLLSAALLQMLEIGPKGRQDLGLKARERIIQNYSLEKLISRTSDRIESLV